MEVITVKNIAQSCSNLLQKYKGRPEKGKIYKKTFCRNFCCESSDLCSRFENLIQVIFIKSGLKIIDIWDIQIEQQFSIAWAGDKSPDLSS